MLLVKFLFWITCGLTIFPYVIYPLVLRVLRNNASLPKSAEALAFEDSPSVTIIVSARNEAGVIEEKIRNALALDYPSDLLNVLVVSDSSTDETDAIVRSFSESTSQVKLLAIEERRGKTAGLNKAMEQVETDLVVFTDANAMFETNALRELVAPFRDAVVGYVVGAQKYTQAEGQTAGENEGLYWRFELALKKAESDFYSVVGGDGAIYAIRRELFSPLADEDINDFVNPLQIILKGKRGVFRAQAIAYEDPANSFDKEFNRKRRIVCRSWGALLRYGANSEMLSLPKFAFMVISHKVLRWFSMVWIVSAVVLNMMILVTQPSVLYLLTATLILGSMILAILGRAKAATQTEVRSIFAIPYYFYMANIAASLGVLDYARGNRYVVWDHVRTTT